MLKIEIPNYIRQIKTANARNPQYYTWSPKTNIISYKSKRPPVKIVKAADKKLFSKNKRAIKLANLDIAKYTIGVLRRNKLIDYVVFANFQTHGGVFLHDYAKVKSNKFILLDLKKKEPVLANPQVAGKARYYTINSQDLYSGNMHHHLRGKVVKAIKKSFLPFVKNLPVIEEYPIKVQLIICDTPENVLSTSNSSRWDLLNRGFIYIKCFEDLIATGKTGAKDPQGNKIIHFQPIIKDDSIRYLSSTGQISFVPIDEGETPKLVFFISKDVRPTLNHSFYEQ